MKGMDMIPDTPHSSTGKKPVTGKKFIRRQYLVDRSFQLAFVGNILLIVMVTIMVTTLVVSWIFVFVLNENLLSGVADTGYLMKIGIIVLCIALAVLVWTIRRTHDIVGPIRKTRRILQELAQGKFPDHPVIFRHGDAFHYLADDLNLCLKTIAARYGQMDIQRLEKPHDNEEGKGIIQ